MFLYPCINYSTTVRRKTAEYSWIVAIFVTLLCVAPAVWPERARVSVSSAKRIAFVTRGGVLFTESSFIPHLGFSVAPGQRARGTRGHRWDHPWLTVWPRLSVDPWLSVGPRMFGVACGCQWHLWLQWGLRSSVGPVVVGVARGPWADPRWLPGPSPPVCRPRLLLPGTLAPEISQLCFQKCPSRLLCSPWDGGSIEARDKCLHTDSPLATVNVCRGHQATAHLPAPATPPRESAFL